MSSANNTSLDDLIIQYQIDPEALLQVAEIFPDAPKQKLCIILSSFNGNTERAIEYLLTTPDALDNLVEEPFLQAQPLNEQVSAAPAPVPILQENQSTAAAAAVILEPHTTLVEGISQDDAKLAKYIEFLIGLDAEYFSDPALDIYHKNRQELDHLAEHYFSKAMKKKKKKKKSVSQQDEQKKRKSGTCASNTIVAPSNLISQQLFPKELLFSIFKFLSIEFLFTDGRLICKHWNDMIFDDSNMIKLLLPHSISTTMLLSWTRNFVKKWVVPNVDFLNVC